MESLDHCLQAPSRMPKKSTTPFGHTYRANPLHWALPPQCSNCIAPVLALNIQGNQESCCYVKKPRNVLTGSHGYRAHSAKGIRVRTQLPCF